VERRQNVVVLGATGSVGASALQVVARHEERYRVLALTANRSAAKLLALARVHRPRYAILAEGNADSATRRELANLGTELLVGAQSLVRIAEDAECDVVVAAIVGCAGLPATLAAVRAGKTVLIANKEVLVAAGQLVMPCARESGARLLPIDSEHSGVSQCWADQGVSRIVLTASGGPFLSTPLDRLERVTPDEACAHPTWAMGRKISVDSATMMNKALEVIEAHWLFGLPADRIDVLVHPQSIVHALVEYDDGSVIAQMAVPDMRIPIAAALAHPGRVESGARRLDLASVGRLAFERPDPERFPCLRLGYRALALGGTAPAILNAANEVAVQAFLDGEMPFRAIAQVVREVLESTPAGRGETLEEVLDADRGARARTRAEIRRTVGAGRVPIA